ncbi:MAG TPA: alginate lyase family protein [Bryobacteraceae bacterium]|nr:alginate lyase family protein [Bryobacteraceae bacterium]
MRILACLVWAPFLVAAAAPPATLVSDDEAEPLRSAITRKETWTQDAARRLRAEADRRLAQGPWSVTNERPAGLILDPHEYYSEAPYWWPNPDDPLGPYLLRDGHYNPDRFSANRTSLNFMSDTVFVLGAAAYLFDDERYSQRAERVIQTWFLSPKTRMNPNLEYARVVRGVGSGRPSGILEGRALLRAIVGMEFLSRTGNWDAKDQAAVHKWFEEYLRWLTQSKTGIEEKTRGIGQASWWTAQVASVATFVQDEAAQKMAFNNYREHVFPKQSRAENRSDNSAPREDVRTAVFDLEGSTVVCRIAELQGVDLWSLHSANGSHIGTLINAVEPYLSDPRLWNRDPGSDIEPDGIYFVAFAGMGLKNPDYIALYQKLEHPDDAWLSLVDLLVGRWAAAGHQTRH